VGSTPEHMQACHLDDETKAREAEQVRAAMTARAV